MNRNRPTGIGRVGLLCLLAGSLPWIAVPAVAAAIEALPLEQSQKLSSADDRIAKNTLPSTQPPAGINRDNLLNSPLEQASTVGDGIDFPSSTNREENATSPRQGKTTNDQTLKPVEESPTNSFGGVPSTIPESRVLAQRVERSNPESSSMGGVTSVSELLDSAAQESSSMGQVTSVSQLSDVQPGDWAYEALRNLVERYGCIAGYPDGTFRGNRAMTRYEFAAGLNACLQQIERLIASGGNDFVNQEEFASLQRLVSEFETELTTLGTRVDNLEGRVATLEDNQFSTTTKLNGEAIISVVGATGGDPDEGDDANIILTNRLRLNLNTSFTGKDLLITGLQANNFGGDVAGEGSVQGTLFPGASSFLSEGMTKLSFEPQFPGFNPQDLSSRDANDIELYKLLYIFPSGIRNLTLFAGTAAEVSDAFPAIIPFSSEGQGAISRFATLNPVVRVSGGTTQQGLASAAGFIWTISDRFDLRALYGSVNAALPNQGDNNVLGAGLFSGSTVAAAQLTIKPTNSIDIGLNYAHSYHDLNILGVGTSRFSSSPLNIPGRTINADGSINLDGALNTPVNVNSVGATLTWRFTPKIALTGYGSYFFVDSAAGPDASSELSSWMVGLYFQDLFKEGNAAGLIFGQPLYRVEAGGAASLTEDGVDRATPYHLEAFYRLKVNDNISITPGAFVLFNPEGDANNDTTVVGVLRTTFTF